jgi:hypothetical protein
MPVPMSGRVARSRRLARIVCCCRQFGAASRITATLQFDGKVRFLFNNTSEILMTFCTKGCYESFYLKRCLVCENNKPVGSTARRKLCRRPKCKNSYSQNRSLFTFLGTDTSRAPNASRNPIKSGIKIGHDGDRPWRNIAGPQLTAAQFHCATVPDGPNGQWKDGGHERIEARNRAALREHFGKQACLIGPHDSPVNIVGWYKFPNAPAIDLSFNDAPAPMTIEQQTRLAGLLKQIPPDLSIPDWLRRAA